MATHAFTDLAALVRSDPEYAWALHCNIAVPIMDAIGVSHADANSASANVMQTLFGYDITTHPHFEAPKSAAQEHFQMRVAAEEAEDAEKSA